MHTYRQSNSLSINHKATKRPMRTTAPPATRIPEKIPGSAATRIKLTDCRQGRVTAVQKALLITKDSPLTRIAEHPINVMTLNTEDRKLLLAGPRMNIKTKGGIMIRPNVPLRALLASCQDVHDVIQTRPNATEMHVASIVDFRAIKTVLNTFTTTALLPTREINLVNDGFATNILTYQACLALGIHYIYTNPLLHALRATITSRSLSRDELDAVIVCIPNSNPLVKHLANDLCHKRFKKEILDIGAFEMWLSGRGKEGLKRRMLGIDQAHRKRREAIILRKCGWRNDNVLAAWGQDKDKGEKTLM